MSDSLYRHNFNTRGSTATVWLSPFIIMMFSSQRSEKMPVPALAKSPDKTRHLEAHHYKAESPATSGIF